ncbi:cytochrome c oxidase assembly factor 3, mitochondrial [Anabrus simplex]|uniref:cytochrome c oxidase assembly factor 3, mitochondrial n=1 Tax=Anabrus simplex TaxID=316456 RepID=UPI0034DCE6DA
MGNSDKMHKIDLVKDKANIPPSMLEYMKMVEKQNLERVEKLQRMRRNNISVGCLLGFGVLGIYFYSMYAVKQEKFLDDFDEPEKTSH